MTSTEEGSSRTAPLFRCSVWRTKLWEERSCAIRRAFGLFFLHGSMGAVRRTGVSVTAMQERADNKRRDTTGQRIRCLW